jgi:signal transduction histidine kinase
MGTLHSFADLNRNLILFVYGLAFFTLGLATALQSRHSSRLDLARSLSWLAAFGFTHGLYVWGELFSPEQEIYLSAPFIELLHSAHLLLLGISLACLFEFGVTLLRPLGRARWLRGFPAVLLAIWICVGFFALPRLLASPIAWHDTAEALARYSLGLFGALLAAHGLRQQTFRRIAPLNVPHIVNMLRIAGLALLMYAIFGGLLPPPVPFFPGNVLNAETFEHIVGLPPALLQALTGLVLAITFIRALEIFDVETARMIEAMEQQQILAAERDHIARDLHDGVIQKVYTAGLLVESAQQHTAPDSPAANRLTTAVTVLNDAIGDLRRNIGELHTTPPDDALPIALRRLVDDPRFRSLVDITLDLDLSDTARLSPTRAAHVLAIVNEALSNVVRHAQARSVRVSALVNAGRLQLRVQDDGLGLPQNLQAGYGLRNMHDRARLLDGQLDVSTANGKGTLVKLDVPWKDAR